jgi:hypothetical protein
MWGVLLVQDPREESILPEGMSKNVENKDITLKMQSQCGGKFRSWWSTASQN